jgi:hypothetical protein
MKKLLTVLILSLFVVSLLAGCGGTKAPDAKPAEKKFVNIATGGTAGTYYPLGGAIAEILNKNVPGVNASAQSTGASVANINLLKDGKVEMALIQNDITYYAIKGQEMFKDKAVPNLKGIATLYNETVQILTVDKTGIKSIADLKGKRVAVGAAGSGTEANARQILEAFGITYNDIKVQYLSFGEAASGLKDGNVDAAFVTAGFPTAAIQDIATQHKVVLLPVEADKADALIKKYPFYAKVTIPGNTYPGQTANVAAVAVKAMLVVTDKMDADLAFNITKAIYDNVERMKAAHSVGKEISKESAKQGMSVELHAGAAKFFQ